MQSDLFEATREAAKQLELVGEKREAIVITLCSLEFVLSFFL